MEPPYSLAIGGIKIRTTPPLDYARSCIRVSLAPTNTKEEIELLLQALAELYSLSFSNS